MSKEELKILRIGAIEGEKDVIVLPYLQAVASEHKELIEEILNDLWLDFDTEEEIQEGVEKILEDDDETFRNDIFENKYIPYVRFYLPFEDTKIRETVRLFIVETEKEVFVAVEETAFVTESVSFLNLIADFVIDYYNELKPQIERKKTFKEDHSKPYESKKFFIGTWDENPEAIIFRKEAHRVGEETYSFQYKNTNLITTEGIEINKVEVKPKSTPKKNGIAVID